MTQQPKTPAEWADWANNKDEDADISWLACAEAITLAMNQSKLDCSQQLLRDQKRLLIAIKALEKIAHPYTNLDELSEIAEDALASLLHVDGDINKS